VVVAGGVVTGAGVGFCTLLFNALSTIAPPPTTVAAVNILENIELGGLVDGAVVVAGLVFVGKFATGAAGAGIVAGVAFLAKAGAGIAGDGIVAGVTFLAKAGAGAAGVVMFVGVVFVAKAGTGAAGGTA
jgi:hypothetical protein